jgi:hypothetical protein
MQCEQFILVYGGGWRLPLRGGRQLFKNFHRHPQASDPVGHARKTKRQIIPFSGWQYAPAQAISSPDLFMIPCSAAVQLF